MGRKKVDEGTRFEYPLIQVLLPWTRIRDGVDADAQTPIRMGKKNLVCVEGKSQEGVSSKIKDDG